MAIVESAVQLPTSVKRASEDDSELELLIRSPKKCKFMFSTSDLDQLELPCDSQNRDFAELEMDVGSLVRRLGTQSLAFTKAEMKILSSPPSLFQTIWATIKTVFFERCARQNAFENRYERQRLSTCLDMARWFTCFGLRRCTAFLV